MDTNILLEYVCPAFPPIDSSKSYRYGKDEKGTYIINSDKEKEYMELEMIKMLFAPKESKWDEVLKPVLLKKK
jgi:hypothetical protein